MDIKKIARQADSYLEAAQALGNMLCEDKDATAFCERHNKEICDFIEKIVDAAATEAGSGEAQTLAILSIAAIASRTLRAHLEIQGIGSASGVIAHSMVYLAAKQIEMEVGKLH